MAFDVLMIDVRPITCKDVWAIPEEDLKKPEIRKKLEEYDQKVNSKLSDPNHSPEELPNPPDELFEWDEDVNITPMEPEKQTDEADDYTLEELDEYLTAEVLLPHGGENVRAKVIQRAKDADGIPIGKRHPNPILDTRSYEVEFPDGSTEVFNTNMIAEHLYSQVDDEGRSYQVIKEIVGHCRNDDAVK